MMEIIFVDGCLLLNIIYNTTHVFDPLTSRFFKHDLQISECACGLCALHNNCTHLPNILKWVLLHGYLKRVEGIRRQ